MCTLHFKSPKHYSSATASNIVLPTQNKARRRLTQNTQFTSIFWSCVVSSQRWKHLCAFCLIRSEADVNVTKMSCIYLEGIDHLTLHESKY